MNVIDGIRSYIFEDDLKITIVKRKINILNYVDIHHFDSNKVIVKTNFKDVVVCGDNLVVSKLMNSEVLITGDFKTIEFR